MKFDNYIVRLITIDDIEAYYRDGFEKPDKEADYYTGTVETFNKDQIVNYVKKIVDDPTRRDFVIEKDTEIIGEIVINDIKEKTCHYRICIFKSQNFSKGIGTKGSQLVLKYIFEELGLEIVGLEVFPFNNRARSAYKKMGFEEIEQIVDEEMENPYKDVIVMRLTKENFYAKVME